MLALCGEVVIMEYVYDESIEKYVHMGTCNNRNVCVTSSIRAK